MRPKAWLVSTSNATSREEEIRNETENSVSQILKEVASVEIQDPQHDTYVFASWEKVHGWPTNLDRQSEWLQSVVSSRVFRE
jgi:hypothetical protein